jgi:cytochrome c2
MGVRPTLRMPNFLLSENEARALAAYLSAQHDTTRSKKFSFEFQKYDSTRVAEGKEIFQDYACYGCHKIAGNGGDMGPDLSEVGSRLQPEYLAAFLRNPPTFIPGTPMKISDLWEEEVQALVAYLMTLKESRRAGKSQRRRGEGGETWASQAESRVGHGLQRLCDSSCCRRALPVRHIAQSGDGSRADVSQHGDCGDQCEVFKSGEINGSCASARRS